MKLSEAGQIVQQAWTELPAHYADIQLDEFVVMPNHVHGIIWITESEPTQKAVGAGFKPAPTRHGLSEIVRGFKTYSARKINDLKNTKGSPFWQRGFYEHVIREDTDLENHRLYILYNPLKWSLDEYHQ